MTVYKSNLLPSIYRGETKDLRKIDEDLFRALNELNDNLDVILNQGINFSENFDSVYVTHTFGATPDTEESIAHDLGRVPTGYIPVTKDKAADVYNTSAPTKTTLFLKCNVSSATIKLLVF